MKNLKFSILLTIINILLLSFCSCKQSFSPKLRECDRLLSTNYKQGNTMLDSLNEVGPKMSTANKKYMQLLRLKAADKAYSPITQQKQHIDTLISYFQHAGDNNLLAEAYYYAGRVYYEIGDKPRSLEFYQKAKDNVAKDNYALQGDIYCQMANVYRYKGLVTEALEALHHASIADSLNGNLRNQLFDIRDIGEIYYDENKISKAKDNYLKGLKLAKSSKDSFMTKCFNHNLASIYVKEEKWDKALFHVNQYIHQLQDITDKSGMLVIAMKVYTHTKNKNMADSCQKEIMKMGNVFAKHCAFENALNQEAVLLKDTKLASDLCLYEAYTDSVIQEYNATAVKRAEQEYNYNLKEQEYQHLRSKEMIMSISFILIIIVALLVIVYFTMKVKNIRQQKKILELKLDKYRELKNKEKEKSIEERTNEEADIKDSAIYQSIKHSIENQEYRLSDEHWTELTKLINNTYPGFDKNLHAFLDVNSQEYKICLLIKIGITPTNIAHFLNLTKEAITASRRRMYTKSFHKRGTPADWDKIIISL